MEAGRERPAVENALNEQLRFGTSQWDYEVHQT